DLLKAVRAGTFREDLYYRLNVFPVSLPPLRDRVSDIPILAHFFLNKFTGRIGKRLSGISPMTVQRLQSYRWPGNVRELDNVLERAVILAEDEILEIDPMLLAPSPADASADSDPSNLATLERNHILAILNQADWVIDGPRGAAKLLGLHPNTLRSRMKKMGL